MKKKLLSLIATKEAENIVLALELAKAQKIELGANLEWANLKGANLKGTILEK